jgi:predicted PurR-regulated permease PerM
MLGLDSRAFRIAWTIIFAAILCYLIYSARHVLLLVVLAILVSYLLRPLVNFVDRRMARRVSRTAALAAVYLIVVGVIINAAVLVTTSAANEASSLAQRLPDLLQPERIDQIPLPPALETHRQEIVDSVRSFAQEHVKEIVQSTTRALIGILGALSGALSSLVVIVLSFFFLKDGPVLVEKIISLLPPGAAATAREIGSDIDAVLAQYIRAIVLIALVTGVAYGIGLSLLRAPYAVLLAVFATPCEFIPVVGPMVAFALIVTVCFFSGYTPLWAIVAFIIIVRMLQDYVVQPYVYSSGIALPPVLVILGALTGERLAGIAGLLLAMPVLAVLSVLVRRLRPVSEEPKISEK